MKTFNIANLDKNFSIESSVNEDNLKFYSVRSAPFRLYGLEKCDGQFRRMPTEIAEQVSEGVHRLHFNTAGGRVRFATDSSYVAIKAFLPSLCHMSHMALTGSSGFDLFANGVFAGSFAPPTNMDGSYDSIVHLKEVKMQNMEINFPLYNDVAELFIGIEDTAQLSVGADYTIEKPVVYYGSSITQGGCASRPGTAYQAIISRMLDCNHINLGFSGNARGEQVMADYIASLDMSAFVLDYDHNAPNAEHLQKTHEPFFRTVREKHPDLPILIVSKPDTPKPSDFAPRRNIVHQTYINALTNGDKNVYFIDGQSFFSGRYRDCCTVDGCHPTDAGFVRMADVIGGELERIFKRG